MHRHKTKITGELEVCMDCGRKVRRDAKDSTKKLRCKGECVYVCVCVRERERENTGRELRAQDGEGEAVPAHTLSPYICVCVCVCITSCKAAA